MKVNSSFCFDKRKLGSYFLLRTSWGDKAFSTGGFQFSVLRSDGFLYDT